MTKLRSGSSVIPFVNNKGNVMHLKGSLTIGDLVRMGATNFRIVPKGTPLCDGEWKDATVADTVAPNMEITSANQKKDGV